MKKCFQCNRVLMCPRQSGHSASDSIVIIISNSRSSSAPDLLKRGKRDVYYYRLKTRSRKKLFYTKIRRDIIRAGRKVNKVYVYFLYDENEPQNRDVIHPNTLLLDLATKITVRDKYSWYYTVFHVRPKPDSHEPRHDTPRLSLVLSPERYGYTQVSCGDINVVPKLIGVTNVINTARSIGGCQITHAGALVEA